jgi:hypothetical protein
MKIKNLYINVVSKLQVPKEEEVVKAVDRYVEAQLKQDPNFTFNKEELLEEAKEQLTKRSIQMRKINKILPLDAFIRQNIHNITEMGKPLILKKSEFRKLCLDCNFPPVDYIDVLFDSNTTFCKIISVDREQLALALAEKKITPEKFDELMLQVEE